MPVPEWARRILGGQTDEQLRRWSDNASALAEIENTRGYKLIVTRFEEELAWSKKQLETANAFTFPGLQAYVSAINIPLGFIKATSMNAQAASELLSERSESKKPKSIDEYHEQIFGKKSA